MSFESDYNDSLNRLPLIDYLPSGLIKIKNHSVSFTPCRHKCEEKFYRDSL